MDKVIENLHTYDPSCTLYSKWISSVLGQYLSDLYGKTEDELNIDGIAWNLEGEDDPANQNKLITKQNKYDTIYIKAIRKRFLKIAADNMSDELMRKITLLSFQNPLNPKYWCRILKLDDDMFAKFLVAGIKELDEIVYNRKENSSMHGIIKFITENMLL